jgi:uncharacterized protein (TIGR03083 family)
VVEQLAEVWASVVDACREVPAEWWDRNTDCPGWTVKDQLSHLTGVERMLLGDPAPPPPAELPPYVANDFGALNQAWVEAGRSVSGAEVLAGFIGAVRRRLVRLRSLAADEFDTVTWGPQGAVPYRQFLVTRIIDTWAHEQDIRRALGRPGGRDGAGRSVVLDHCARTMPYVVGKRVAPPDGTSVSFHVTGAGGRRVVVTVAGGRASMAPSSATARVTATLTLDAQTFWRLCYGRVAPETALGRGEVLVGGDTTLGRRVVDAMAFMT